MNELSLQILATCKLNGIPFPKDWQGQFNVDGFTDDQGTARFYPGSLIQKVTDVDEVLILPADIDTIGYLFAKNLALPGLAKIGEPGVVVIGTPGAATWSYKVVARRSSDGANSAASDAGTVATGNATLSSSNKNRIIWGPIAGADYYDVYRTAHGTTPSTNGLITSTSSTTYDDEGAAGDSSTAPATASDNIILLGSNGTSYPNKLRGLGFMAVEWNGAAIHVKTNVANPVDCDLEYLVLPR